MPHRFVSRGTIVTAFAFLAVACSQGTQAPAAAAPQPAAAAKSAALPDGVTPLMIAAGDSLFHASSCVRCHGADAKGTPRGANLTDDQWSQITGTYPEIVQVIIDGVPQDKIKLSTAQFPMRPRGGSSLPDDTIRKIAAYVYSLSHR